MLRQLTYIAVFTLAFNSSIVAGAASIQSLSGIESVVTDFVLSRVGSSKDMEFSIGRLDPRLRLPACDQALAARSTHATHSQGPMSIEVRCQGAKPWVLYVPVQISRFAEVAVIARAVARDRAIEAEDLKLERRRVDNRRASYLVDLADVVGQVATRNLSPGSIVTANVLKKPHLVRRGDQVTLRLGSKSVSVRTRGEALQDGVAGERIDVLNLSSNRVVEGIVKGIGEVIVGSNTML